MANAEMYEGAALGYLDASSNTADPADRAALIGRAQVTATLAVNENLKQLLATLEAIQVAGIGQP
jgi:hypothetical protein